MHDHAHNYYFPLLMLLLLLVIIISSTREQALHEIYVVSTNTHLLCTFCTCMAFCPSHPPPLTDPRSLSNAKIHIYIPTGDHNYDLAKKTIIPSIDHRTSTPPPTSPSRIAFN